MMTKPPVKRQSAKLTTSAKLLMGTMGITAFIGGWGMIGRQENKPDLLAATQTPDTQPPAIQPISMPGFTATPWPTIAPLTALPPMPTVAPLNPNRMAVNQPEASVAGMAIAPALNLAAPIPTLAPLPAMPAPPPPPPPPSNNGGGGGNSGGGGGNSTKGS